MTARNVRRMLADVALRDPRAVVWSPSVGWRDRDVTTFADGYGLWHAIVRGETSEETARVLAYDAIVQQIRVRSERRDGTYDVVHDVDLVERDQLDAVPSAYVDGPTVRADERGTFHYVESDQENHR